jgi:cytochrome P450
MGRMSTREVHLGLYNISDCAQVFFSYYIIGRDPQYFPDPLRFDQDRFTQPKPHAPDRPISPSAAASRQCIGEPFAWIEAVTAIATIARRWRFGRQLDMQTIDKIASSPFTSQDPDIRSG